jgi:hypothetical protein
MAFKYSQNAGCYWSSNLSDFDGWQILRAEAMRDKGHNWKVVVSRGKQTRTVYVSKTLGLTLQSRAREDSLAALAALQGPPARSDLGKRK